MLLRSFEVIFFVISFAKFSDANPVQQTFDVRGYLPQYQLTKEIDNVYAQQVAEYISRELLEQGIECTIEDLKLRELGRERLKPTLNFAFTMTTEVPRDNIIKTLESSTTIRIVLVTKSQGGRVKEKLSRPTRAAPCHNDGVLLSNNTCWCPPFTTGDKCQTVICNRFGISEEDSTRCYCPPGWYAKNCEIRGCRPPVEANLDVSRRSLVVALPIIESMKQEALSIVENLKSTVSVLEANEPGYLGSFILVLLLETDNSVSLHDLYFTSVDDMVWAIRDSVVTGDEVATTLPMMHAIELAQTMKRSYLPYAIILAFTDRGDSDATDKTFKLADNTRELRVTQLSLIWRSRVYIFFTGSSLSSDFLDSNSYDTYRRVAAFTHGELFRLRKDEISTILQSFVSRLYKPEYLDVVSYTDCSDVSLRIGGNGGDPTSLLITVDKSDASSIDWSVYFDDTIAKSDVGGPSWMLFTVPVGSTFIKIHSPSKLICSIRTFISSRSTLLWAYNDFPPIDVGNGISLAEVEMFVTARMVNFPPLSSGVSIDGVTYDPFALLAMEMLDNYSGRITSTRAVTGSRRADDCTFDIIFESSDNCHPGPFTQRYTIPMIKDNKNINITRTYPGFCIQPTYHTAGTSDKDDTTDGNSCKETIAEVNEPRFGSFRHIFFLVEVSREMSAAAGFLASTLSEVVTAIEEPGVLRYYTMILFDDQGKRAVVSDYNVDAFMDRATASLNFTNARSLNGTLLLEAIETAANLSLVSPSIVHVFTATKTKLGARERIVPADMQVNIYNIDHYNNDPSALIVQQQSGGRMMFIESQEISKMSHLLTSATNHNDLVFDQSMQNCTDPTRLSIPIEQSVRSVEITFDGQCDYLTIIDGDGTSLPIEEAEVVFTNAEHEVVLLDMTALKLKAGQWAVICGGLGGSCSLQVRVWSDVSIVLGFTSNLVNDTIATLPFSNRGYVNNAYVTVRHTGGIELPSLSIAAADSIETWTSSNRKETSYQLTINDAKHCLSTPQFASNLITMPKSPFVTITVIGTSENGTPIQRVFHYYTPKRTDDSECFGNKINEFGECVCPSGYSGEFCTVPICINGGTASHGICMCNSGYIGTFCDEPMTEVVVGHPIHDYLSIISSYVFVCYFPYNSLYNLLFSAFIL